MDVFKKFFEKKKLDVKFKKAGTGRSLGASSPSAGPSSAPQARPGAAPYTVAAGQAVQQREKSQTADVAAAAALQRLQVGQKQQTRSQRNIQMQAKKELDKEREAGLPRDGLGAGASSGGCDEREFEHAPVMENQAVAGVFFTCDLLGDVALTKEEMQGAVAEFLKEQMAEDPLISSALMIQSLNGSKEKRQTAVETLCKYLDNLIANPGEEKFRKIRRGHKAFQERVCSSKGGAEFLKAVGFEEVELSPPGEGPPEPYLVISAGRVADTASLQHAKDVLVGAEPIPLKLHRNPGVLVPGSRKLADLQLPDSFFERSADEVKKEQQAKTEEVDRLLSLRTGEMRSRDETLRVYKYRYSLIRVKFPGEGGLLVQATFGSLERLAAVGDFLRTCLDVDAPFLLRNAKGEPLEWAGGGGERSLAELGLAPAAVLHFEWERDVLENWAAAGQPPRYLRQEWAAAATLF